MTYSNLQEMGKPITVKDEGVLLSGSISSIDFVGAGVTSTVLGYDTTVTIPGGVGTPSTNETPTGTVDGVNAVFTTAHTPISGTLAVYVGGSRQKLTEDYTVTGSTITFNSAPMVGSILVVDYEY